MGVTAQAGILGFGPQSGKGVLPAKWYRHRATVIDFDVTDPVNEGAPEVGGLSVPTFPYKTGPITAGGFTLQPRLMDTLGWLLYGLMGAHSVSASGGAFTHTFGLAANSGFVPWMGFRKLIPAVDDDYATDLGQIFQDCKMIGGTLTLPNSAPVTLRAEALGCGFTFDDAPNAWTWENTYEHWESIPLACATDGVIQVAGETLPVVAMQVGFANVPQDLRQQRIFGSPFLDDVTILQRRLTFDMQVKWKNPDLYRKIIGGAANATAWSSHPYTGALHVKTVSSVDMPSLAEPYSLEVDASEIMLSQAGGIQLAGNESIMMRFTGVALEGTPYATFKLRNKQADYVWPA